MKLFIMRGLPGSGKSTKAKKLALEHDAVICSTDSYFYDENGIYNFDFSKLGEYHTANQIAVRDLVSKKRNIIVDNTNTTLFEMLYYIQIGLHNSYEIELVYSKTEWAWDITKCLAKCTKPGMTLNILERMFNRFEGINENLSFFKVHKPMEFKTKLPDSYVEELNNENFSAAFTIWYNGGLQKSATYFNEEVEEFVKSYYEHRANGNTIAHLEQFDSKETYLAKLAEYGFD